MRAWWALDDGAVLELRDVRRFGRIGVVPAGEYASLPTLAAQGPEPWDAVLDDDGLWRNLRRSTAHVKTQLLSQRPIAGVGNIYADEALWRAGIHPARRSVTQARGGPACSPRSARCSSRASPTAAPRCATTARSTGEPGRNQLELGCYGRAGEPCGRCGASCAAR